MIRAARERPGALFDGVVEGDPRRRRLGPGGAGGRVGPGDAARPASRAPRPCPLDLSRTLDELLGGRRVRHRPRPRPVRAQRLVGRASPLAVAERRQLPRADRADPLDPGGAAAGRDLLRPARRPHGELAGDLGADGALLPGQLRAGRARRGPRWARGVAGESPTRQSSPRPSEPVRIAFCLDEERGALRIFLRALRRLPLELAWEAAIWRRDAGRGADRAAAARPGAGRSGRERRRPRS